MARLEDLLAESLTLSREIQRVAKEKDRESRDIIAMRTKLADLIAGSVAAMHQDERLKANPAVRREFETGFFAFRQRLAKHQADWRKANIDKDPQGYDQSAAELNALRDEFYQYALRELPKL